MASSSVSNEGLSVHKLAPETAFHIFFQGFLVTFHDFFHVFENRPYFDIYTTITVLFQTLHGHSGSNYLIYHHKFIGHP